VSTWVIHWERQTDAWHIITLELAGNNPSEAKRIKRECTYFDIADAWACSRRGVEGVGYYFMD